jgi:transcriptional regulator with XRE-family HTH domain
MNPAFSGCGKPKEAKKLSRDTTRPLTRYNKSMPKETDVDYGQFIKDRRRALNLSQQDLATALSCTPQAVSKYESGQSKIYLGLLGSLCRCLQVDLESFLSGVPEKHDSLCEEKEFSPSRFAESIAFLREKQSLTQKGLAEKAGVTLQKVSKWETGKSLPTLAEFMTLTKVFGLSPSDFYFVDSEKESKLPQVAPAMKEKHSFVTGAILLSLSALLLISGITIPIVLKKTAASKEGTSTVVRTYTVSYLYTYQGTVLDQVTRTVKEGDCAESLPYTREGYLLNRYELEGQPFDFTEPVSGNLALIGTLSKESYSVTFLGLKGKILKTQNVLYEEDATPPDSAEEAAICSSAGKGAIRGSAPI